MKKRTPFYEALKKHRPDLLKNSSSLLDIELNLCHFLRRKEAKFDYHKQTRTKEFYYGNELAVTVVNELTKEDYTHKGIIYPNTIVGGKEVFLVHYFDGSVFLEKKNIYDFNLEPVYDVNDSSKIKSFSSGGQQKILEAIRRDVDAELKGKSPDLYLLIYRSYYDQYKEYKDTGYKQLLFNAIDNETRPQVLGYLDKTDDTTGLKVRALIKAFLP